MRPKRLSIVGVGLLGGSIGLAVRACSMSCEITGYGHRQATLDRAVEIGAIDRGVASVAQAVQGADLVILASPVSTFENLLKEMRPGLSAGAVVTDVGSTKRSVVQQAEEILPRGVHFVGSHPMAGSEKRGVEFARADLFANATCILTPTRRTHREALGQVEGFWKELGMNTVRLSPDEHDRLLADISHLPHALAAALVAMQSEAGLPLAGKGFLDTTRVAGGDGGLWRDIFLDNRDNLKGSIERLQRELEALLSLLDADDGQKLAAWLDAAARRRAELLRQKLAVMEG